MTSIRSLTLSALFVIVTIASALPALAQVDLAWFVLQGNGYNARIASGPYDQTPAGLRQCQRIAALFNRNKDVAEPFYYCALRTY